MRSAPPLGYLYLEMLFMTEIWKLIWVKAIAPLLDDRQIDLLAEAIERDDPRLLQGATTTPPPLACVQDWPADKCCALSFTGMAAGLKTVGEIEEYFARMCFEIDQRWGEPAACRYFLNWYDETPREIALPRLARACRETLAQRQALEACAQER
jgi:hypothetical protein